MELPNEVVCLVSSIGLLLSGMQLRPYMASFICISNSQVCPLVQILVSSQREHMEARQTFLHTGATPSAEKYET